MPKTKEKDVQPWRPRSEGGTAAGAATVAAAASDDGARRRYSPKCVLKSRDNMRLAGLASARVFDGPRRALAWAALVFAASAVCGDESFVQQSIDLRAGDTGS